MPEAKENHCLTFSTRSISSAGPVAQPIFQPVTENVLPAEETVTVRSAIPGSVEIGMCTVSSLSSKSRCS